MIKYTSQNQLKLQEFGNLYQMKLNANNRWIKLGLLLPWDKFVSIFAKYFADGGRLAINPRIVIGSLIIKHKLCLSDEETVMIIEENPYMQVFLGLDEFSPKPLFSASLFVEWRKKLGLEAFNSFSDILIEICFGDQFAVNNDEKVENKGKLKLDATVADQNITFPNDLGLLNTAREKTEGMIDILFKTCRKELPVKPRTYRKLARKRYLAESKKRQTNPKTLRAAIRYQLNCLDRNIISINSMLDLAKENPLKKSLMRDFWVIQHVNTQQREMYDQRSNRCDDRIVSISQPYVRPIVRGKAGKKVEFGSKIGIVHIDGFAKVGTLSWDAYNENADLIPHAKAYKELYGYYPELIQVDKIYGSNKNRKWCSKNGIRMTVAKKGRQPEQTSYQKKKSRDEFNERNQVEGKIGQAKQGYELNNIKAKLSDTSKTWVGIILFITNLVKFSELMQFRF